MRPGQMTMGRSIHIFLLIGLLVMVALATSTDNTQGVEIGIDEHLGEYVPLELQFVDEEGDTVQLGDLIEKPTVLNLVYYSCPGLCSPLLDGVVEVLDKLDLEPGQDYQVITVSFNPRETVELAREKKRNYFAAFRLRPDYPPSAWRWLVGDSLNIARLTDAVGFRYRKSGDGYLHSAAIMVLGTDGKISRYLYGITFLPFDLKMAIIEASEGRVGPTISRLLQLCFNYDPEGRRYVFNFLRVAGVLILLFAFIFVVSISLKKKFGS